MLSVYYYVYFYLAVLEMFMKENGVMTRDMDTVPCTGTALMSSILASGSVVYR